MAVPKTHLRLCRLQFKRENSRKWHDSSLEMYFTTHADMQARALMRQEGWTDYRWVNSAPIEERL